MDKKLKISDNLANTKARSPYWDNIKGVLIILVVFAHCLYSLQGSTVNNLIVDAIYYFHMPAFVFVSGFFSKSERCRSRNAVLQLLIAYFLFMLPFLLYNTYLGKQPRIINAYYSAWYLMALVIWRLITPYLAKFKGIMPAIIIFSILVGFWGTINGESALSINKVVTFWPYFMAGYLLKAETVDNKIKAVKTPIRLSAGIVAVAGAALIEAVSYKALHITDRDLLPNKYSGFGLEDPASRIAIMAVSALMIAAFLFLSVDRKIPIITMAGKNSLTIYLFHRIFTMIYSNRVEDLRARWQILGAVLCTLLIVLVFGNNFVSKYVNMFIKNCADSVSFLPNSNEKKNKVYRIILLTLLAIAFIAPICAGFIRN
ncbi:MAG: acyltransferase family protein [Eubacterium sp.]